MTRAGTVVLQAKPQLGISASRFRVPQMESHFCLLIQLPVDVPGRPAGDSPGTLDPVIHLGDPDAVPGSWLRSGLALAVVGM